MTLFPGLIRPARAADPSALLEGGEAVPLSALPANERAVTGLVLLGGKAFGVTTGRAGHLFSFDPGTRGVRSLHRLPGGAGFSFGIVASGGALFAGTQRDPTGLGRSPEPRSVGRLLRFTTNGDDAGGATVEDRGVPAPGEGIQAVAHSPRSQEVVGLTFPGGRFFAHSIPGGSSRDLGAISGHRPFETEAPRQVARALVAGIDGSVYTSGKDGTLFRYDPVERAVAALPARLPAVPGREGWASLDSAAVDPAGTIYGGTSDGYLFRFDPRSGAVVNLGKPIRQGGFQGMVFSPSGILVAVAGERSGVPREVRYDPRSGGFSLGGIPRAGGEPALEGFGAMASDGAGVLYAGELDRIARLIIYRIP